MLFNSIDFAIFLPLVFLMYWFVFQKRLKLQNFFMVLVSFLFYGWWDWRFLSLILFSILIDYFVGLGMAKNEKPKIRKGFLLISIIVNIGFLGFFKYFNFFAESFVSAFSVFGVNINKSSLNIILPVGISFYTFQTLSYSIDVYKRKIAPTKDFFAFAAFVSFFPQLVAGPIERATNLLPQFLKKRTFDYFQAIDGLKQMLWGFFKKMVIADRCAEYANLIFDNSDSLPSGTLILGVFFFAFQIYGDFSGYSDIAIGASKLFGFELKQNFAFPYFSRDIAEFWRRWHISLSTWFRDYVYIPLGGSRGSTSNKIKNIFVIFALSGFWHGANWTFIVWGLINAIYFLPLLLFRKNRINLGTVASGKFFPGIKEFVMILVTFILTSFAWIFFRADNLSHAVSYVSGIFSNSPFSFTKIDNPGKVLTTLLLLGFFILIEWVGRGNLYAIEKMGMTKYRIINWGIFYLIVAMIFVFGGVQQTFIYFQF